jgi:hypothetical protein
LAASLLTQTKKGFIKDFKKENDQTIKKGLNIFSKMGKGRRWPRPTRACAKFLPALLSQTTAIGHNKLKAEPKKVTPTGIGGLVRIAKQKRLHGRDSRDGRCVKGMGKEGETFSREATHFWGSRPLRGDQRKVVHEIRRVDWVKYRPSFIRHIPAKKDKRMNNRGKRKRIKQKGPEARKAIQDAVA